MRYERKKIYLDDNLAILDGNREYFIYFERVGHRFSKIDELVIPEEREAFMNFLLNTESPDSYELFHFEKYTGEYRVNRTSVGLENLNGKKVRCLRLLDIEESFDFFDKAVVEEEKKRLALSIIGNTFFSYDKETNLFRMVHYHDGKCLVDYNLNIDDWKSQMLQKNYFPKDQEEAFEKFVAELKACPSKVSANIVCAIRTEGKIMQPLNFLGTRFVDDDGLISMVGQILQDSKTEIAQDTNRLITELQYDSLTKCYNKKTITEIAKKKLLEAEEGERVAIAIIDLDNFKPVNDAYGHLAGDRVLEETGEALKSVVGEKGCVGRYGGDEFLLVLNHMDNEETLRGTLQAALNTLGIKFENAFDGIKVTPSIGAAVYPDNGTDFSELFKKADFCLYRAKDKGKNRYIFFRDDLHLPLYEKAVESTVGVKYQLREVQELKYMSDFMRDLNTAPFSAIKEVCEHMYEAYGLGDLTIYYGTDLKRIYTVGDKRPEQENALYAVGDDFKKALKDSMYIRMDFPEDVDKDCKEFIDEMKKRGIKSTIQCVLGTPNEIKGLVTFDKHKEAQQWAEYEVNCAAMFAASMNLLPESTKVDFAVYSQLKD